MAIMAHRRRNKVVALKDNRGNWVHDVNLLKNMTIF